MMQVSVSALALLVLAGPCLAEGNVYPWLEGDAVKRTVRSAIALPEGFERTEVAPGSFGDWLRHLPLKEAGAPVLLYNGQPKSNQDVHVAVVRIDVGARDLQQCADAVIRLRAEYLYSRRRPDAVRFHFTNGDEAAFTKWAAGYRPVVHGNNVTWARNAGDDASYPSFRKYLDTVFAYAGSYSLSRELTARNNVEDLTIGDVFILGGFPGHAVIVVDLAQRVGTGEKVFLLAQSYMPAQDVHILKNPIDDRLSPWYRIPSGPLLETPEWTFSRTDVKCFEGE